MNQPSKPENAPGQYGAGDGEQPPGDAPSQPEVVVEAPIATEVGATPAGDDGAPVVFTPDDVHVQPPDRPPTEEAPESEKAGLIFERS